jgi:hypothetical protein
LRATNPIETNQKFSYTFLSLSTLILLLYTPNSALTLVCYSSFIPTMIEGILSGLSTLEHTKVLLPQRGPYRAEVRWILHGDP